MLDSVERNDVEGWCVLAILELRALLARGQAFQARRFVGLLQHAAEAELPIQAYDRHEINQLINAIDAVQAGRHFLALEQFDDVAGSERPLIKWATLMWRARSEAAEGDVVLARHKAEQAVKLSPELGKDATYWATCFAAELQGKAGETAQAEERIFHALSQFIGYGEVRGQSLAKLSLALIHHLAGAAEESEAAADMAYEADGSWTGPPIWLARIALKRDDRARAEDLLGSIPNPGTDAYNLSLALKLTYEQGTPLSVITRTLELAELPPGAQAVGGLRQLLGEHPSFWPAREALAWKLLSMKRPTDARAQLLTMEEDADRQSVAAIRLGLHLLKEEQEPKPEPEPERQRAPTPVPTAAAPERAAQLPALELALKPAPKMRHSGFVGQISLFGVPELLQFLCSARRSGTLLFSSQLGDARIRLHGGSLYWAQSPTNPSVGRFLAQNGAVDDQLAEAMDSAGTDPGQVLGEQAANDQVREGLRQLLHTTVKELVRDWEDGWFQFDRDQQELQPPQELLFNSQGILLDVMREVDEENR